MSGSVNEGEMRKRPFTPSGSSAPPARPTADVEKLITKESALAYFKQFLNGDTGMASAEVLADVMLTVQHQARAPLVEAAKQAIPRLERCMCAGSDGHKLNLKIAKRLALLTGTGNCNERE